MAKDRWVDGPIAGTPRCAAIFNRWRCLNAGRHEHEGQVFCLIHHPPTVKAKADKRHEALVKKGEMKARVNADTIEAAERQRKRAACFDLLVAALEASRSSTPGARHLVTEALEAAYEAKAE
jgi:hypothetical protein